MATADTVGELADGLDVNRDGLVRTIEEYNAAVQEGEYNPAVLDGKGTYRYRAAEVQLGIAHRQTALPGVRRGLRNYLYLRRVEDRRPGPGAGLRGEPDARALCGRRARWRPVLPQLPGGFGPHGRDRVRQDRGGERGGGCDRAALTPRSGPIGLPQSSFRPMSYIHWTLV